MKRIVLLALAGAVGLASTGSASAAPADQQGAVSAKKKAYSWTGQTGSGANVSFFGESLTGESGSCASTSPATMCDETLVKVDVRDTAGAKLTFRIQGFSKASDDFDLRVYTSNAKGVPLKHLGSPTGDVAGSSPLGELDPRHTAAGDFETVTVSTPESGGYYLVQVVYFAVANSSYKGSATLSGLPKQPR